MPPCKSILIRVWKVVWVPLDTPQGWDTVYRAPLNSEISEILILHELLTAKIDFQAS